MDLEPQTMALVDHEVAAAAPCNEVTTSHSHQSLEAATSLPNNENVAFHQRLCVTPEPYIMLSTYAEAERMASESDQRVCLTPTDGEMDLESQSEE